MYNWYVWGEWSCENMCWTVTHKTSSVGYCNVCTSTLTSMNNNNVPLFFFFFHTHFWHLVRNSISSRIHSGGSVVAIGGLLPQASACRQQCCWAPLLHCTNRLHREIGIIHYLTLVIQHRSLQHHTHKKPNNNNKTPTFKSIRTILSSDWWEFCQTCFYQKILLMKTYIFIIGRCCYSDIAVVSLGRNWWWDVGRNLFI